MPLIVEAQNLSKRFKEVTAVDDLSFSVEKGNIYGFLGQNGAGKSTTIRVLLTLIRPTSGTIKIFGKDLQQNRKEILRNIGAIIEKPELYKYLTAIKNIEIFARLSGISPSKKDLLYHLEKVGLASRAESKVKTFSQGMKQRLGIACALIHNPELIILDEPTDGLDPQGIADVRHLILHLSKDEGKTIFVSSHLLSEIEVIADSMLIIDKGKKIAEGKTADLLNPADTLVEVKTTDNEQAKQLLFQSAWRNKLEVESEKIRLHMHRENVPELNNFLVDNGVNVLELRATHSLEEYFLSLTTANQHVATYKN